ncbi:MAG TPA: SRPBCC family protein [Dehalococcoidia bacterium]|jgi:hypothetical protein
MIRIESSVEIEQPAEEVFDYISDLSNLREWQAGVIESRVVTPGPVGVGTIFEETAKVGFWKMLATCTVVEFARPRVMAFKATSTGPIEYDGALRVEAGSAGTRLAITGNARLKGIWRLLEPLLGSDIRRETKEELQAVKRNLAARAARRIDANAK